LEIGLFNGDNDNKLKHKEKSDLGRCD